MRGPRLPSIALGPLLLAACAAPLDLTPSATSTGDVASDVNSVTGAVSTTGTTAPADPTTTSTTSIDGTPFLSIPDGGPLECDVFAQDCPDGQKCAPFANDGGNSWNALECVDIMDNPAQPGDPCFVVDSPVSGLDNCDEGVICWDPDEQNVGTCTELCAGSPRSPSCPDGSICVIDGQGVVNLCLRNCDPLAPDCPNSDDLCIPNPQGDGFRCILDASGDTGAKYDECAFANACDPGNGCFDPTASDGCDPDAEGCCLPFCDLTLSPDPECDPDLGESCTPYYEPGTAPDGDENVGVCAKPA